MLSTHPLILITPSTHQVIIELAYATAHNIANRAIYQRALCLLHRDAENPLRRAAQNAINRGLRLKILDAFRPQEAQDILWHATPDKAYVANPSKGSDHTRGIALDVTLVDRHGLALDMGTAFDDMSYRSHHFCEAVSHQAQANRLLLLDIMEDAGFHYIDHEWWHYALPATAQHALIESALLGHQNPMLAD